VWNVQDVPEELAGAIVRLAPQVALEIRNTPANMRNVGEYCKSEQCWERIAGTDFDVPDLPEFLCLNRDEARAESKDAAAVQLVDNDVAFDTMLVCLVEKAELIRLTALKRQMLSPKSSAALQKVGRSQFALSASERRALQHLFMRLHDAGLPVMSL
jgi:hypothetical protein